MKTLLLMRHAKSSWKHTELKDFDRPLNKRGEKDAPRMGRLLMDQELLPQLILSSPAVRARETVEAFIKASGASAEVKYFDSFYLAEPSVYIDIAKTLPDDLERVMLVGHNPGLEGVVQVLSRQVESLPTAAIAHIVLPIHQWSELTSEIQGELVQLWRPRDLKKA
jgi:phosphohistidine phosphatase